MSNRAPKLDEIEISVIGPGYGESILIHIGNNQWLIIDSCIRPHKKKAASIEYLNSIGVDASESVKLIVATHWDDDHIRGLGEIFKFCTKATFICSDALNSIEFLTLIDMHSDRWDLKETSGVKEFGKIIEEHKHRCENKCANEFKFANSDRPLWKSEFEISGNHFESTVFALAPNDKAVFKAKNELKRILNCEGEDPKAIPPQIKTNHASVVLWITINNLSILLGGDLEEVGNDTGGWTSIVDSKLRPKGKALFFKIPHHGSLNAFCPSVWEKMLVDEPLTVLSPFSKSRSPLPTEEGVKKICSYTPNAYSSSIPGLRKRAKRQNAAVDRTIKEVVGKNIYLKNPSYGQVRFRTQLNQESEVDLFDDACKLCGEN
jgi:beta-lactamase superfamily II metal-dependent hydrolase